MTRADRADRVRALRRPADRRAVAAGLGLLAVTAPLVCLVLVLGAGVAMAVWRRPAVAAYMVIGVTPLWSGSTGAGWCPRCGSTKH